MSTGLRPGLFMGSKLSYITFIGFSYSSSYLESGLRRAGVDSGSRGEFRVYKNTTCHTLITL